MTRWNKSTDILVFVLTDKPKCLILGTYNWITPQEKLTLVVSTQSFGKYLSSKPHFSSHWERINNTWWLFATVSGLISWHPVIKGTKHKLRQKYQWRNWLQPVKIGQWRVRLQAIKIDQWRVCLQTVKINSCGSCYIRTNIY